MFCWICFTCVPSFILLSQKAQLFHLKKGSTVSSAAESFSPWMLMPYSADKMVPFSAFSIRKIIDCLSFIERTDCLRFKDKMIVNKHS